MLKFSVVCLYFAVVAVNFWNVNCISEEEKKAIMEAMKPIADECASDCGLTKDDLKKHKKGDDMDPCFKKCIMQKMGILDEAGKYNREALHESISEYTDDKDKAKKVQEQLDSCFDGASKMLEIAPQKKMPWVAQYMPNPFIALAFDKSTNGDNDGDDEESQMKRVDVLFKCLKELKE